MSPAGKKILAGDFRLRMRGFSIALLLLMTLMSFRIVFGRSADAPVTAARSDIQAGIKTALEMFEVDCGRYPTTSEGIAALVNRPSDIATNRWHGPYLDKLPIDPWGTPYVYFCPAKHSTNAFEIYSCGRDRISKSDGADPDDINSWDEKSPHKYESFNLFFDRVSSSPVFVAIVLLFLGFLTATTFFGVARFGVAMFSSKGWDSIGKRPILHLIWLVVTLFGLFLLLYILLVPKIT